jgi:hypothetical protein
LRPLAVGLLDRLLEAQLVEERLVSSEQRRSKAVWNILSERGLPVAVVRWPASRPAESLYGWVVAEDERGADQLRRPGQGSAPPDEAGLFSPEELRDELDDLLQSRSSGEGLGPGGNLPLPRPSRAGEGAGGPPPGPPPLPIFEKLSADGLAVLEREPDLRVEARSVLAADAFGSRAALRLWRERRPQFLALCLRSLDHLGHRLARVPGAVEGTYRWMDEALGAWLEAVGDDATLVVVSAHGQPLASGAHGREGILVLSGAGVRPGVEFADAPSLYDVAPTLLALYGLPPAREMPGRALLEALEVSARPPASLRPGTYGSYSVRDVLPRGAAVAGAKAAQAVGD